MSEQGDASVDLIVTSPPYPMIEMWDAQFAASDSRIADALAGSDGRRAFALMHERLDAVWAECYRVAKEGAILCVNIGDATRSSRGRFRLYSNHSRIVHAFESLGADSLPVVLWHKQTNAPNKFMGSGMLPAGAYVTLEHEYLLLFRKGGKRDFADADRRRRRGSAYFWEERNRWFSDVWELKGIRQGMRGEARGRSAAFPIELAYRLVSMYSLKEDLVLDPFLGTGTTLAAAMLAGRNSVGYEIDEALAGEIRERVAGVVESGSEIVRGRFRAHLDFIRARLEAGRAANYLNTPHGFRVVTAQEVELELEFLEGCTRSGDTFTATHRSPGAEFETGAQLELYDPA